MIDTVKIILLPDEVGYHWDIEVLETFLEPFDKYKRKGFKPIGGIKNMSVSGNNNILIIEGSLAKFYNENNVKNFDWRFVKPALILLEKELGIPLKNGKISRIDIGVNVGVNYPVIEHFPELYYLEFYQRNTRRKTTLRFENNSYSLNYLLYDKVAESKKDKLISEDLSLFDNHKHLMRIELQLQDRKTIKRSLKIDDLRIADLYEPDIYKVLIKEWLKIYTMIHKKMVLIYPDKMKGLKDFEKFMKRFILEVWTFDELNYFLKSGVKKGCLTSSDKSKKLKQFREAVLDNKNFVYQNHVAELNHKMKLKCVEGLKQIYKLDTSR